MGNSLDIARQILAPAGMEVNDLHKTLNLLNANSIDQADLYFEYSQSESWVLEDGIVREGTHNIEHGVGVRAISGEKTGFAYSDEIMMPALTRAAKTARAIVSHGQQGKLQIRAGKNLAPLYTTDNPLASISAEDKTKILKQIDRTARQKDPRVIQVIASVSGQYVKILIAGIDGTFCADIRPLVRLDVNIIVEENNRRESGNAGCGGRFDYSDFLNEAKVTDLVNEALEQALTNLDAVDAPAGAMTVVLGPGWPGILLHEAIGHGLEGDFNRKGTSAFSNRIGERIATPDVTVVDDGTIPNRRGSLTVDDEGTPSECTVLIEQGILRNYMQDKHNARLMGMRPTGNGRRESYAHLPMPRMTNTYMLNGEFHPEEIIASVDKGVYASQFGGGQVDITNGKFVFSTSLAWKIEHGKLTQPIKGATLIGNGPDVLTRVTMVGNDMRLDSGIGTCGKDGQSVPVGVGQPTIRIDGLTVGGTST